MGLAMELPQEFCRPQIVRSWLEAGCPSFSDWAIQVSHELTRKFRRPVQVSNRTLLGRTQRELKSMGKTISQYRYEVKEIKKPAPPAAPKPLRMEAAVFDIETLDFETCGYEGSLLVTCILDMHADEPEIYAIRFEDHGDDRALLTEVIDALGQYQFLIGHNIASFDFNWLMSRLMYHGMDTPHAWEYFDTYQVAKTLAIKSGRKSLAFLGDFFRIDSSVNEKTAIYPTSWSMARSPNETEFGTMIANCVDHCVKDVKRNRDLFWAMYPYAMRTGSQPWKITKWR
jgi:DNA polymerase III epsilon subunit-like protein